ncbi:MAG TPA: murein biosynthesis integral membrane protein MurJ [Gaiellaceae bacterium]|nr:murein biosynthesis integral membrane protein MurJ [Gaiellaceae bacterium]
MSDDLERERHERRIERDRRRRAQGKPTYFDVDETTVESRPLLADTSEQPTMIIRPARLREEAARHEADELELDWDALEEAETVAALEQDTFSTAETAFVPTPEAPVPHGAVPEPTRRGLAVSTAIFAAATGLSRVLGLVREIVTANFFGVAGSINAFTVAFQIPNLIRALVADAALSSAFVPVFSELLEKGERKRAWRVASSLFWLILLGLSAVTVIYILVAPWVIGLFGNPGGNPSLAVGLSRVLFPIVVLLGISGIIVGILNSYDHFTVPAISPVFWNLAIIVGLVLGVPHATTMNKQLYIYAFSILIATVIQTLLPVPWLRGRDGHLQMVIDWRDPAVKRVFVLMVPVTLGLGLINFNAVIDTFFASRFIDPKLAPSAIQKAFLIYMLPQGIFSVAIATVLFPSLSRYAARGDTKRFRETVNTGLRQIVFLLAPAAVISAVLAEPIVRILFQHGHFTPAQTPVVAGALAAFSAGLVFNGAMLMLNRAFFSLQENWIPTMVALGNLFLNALLDWWFYRYGVWGIPLSTAFVNLAGSWALFVLLRRRLGGVDGGAIAATTLKVVVASAVVAAVAWTVWRPLDSALGRSFGAQLVSLGLALTAAVLTYLGCCKLLQVRELSAMSSLRGRLRRA